MQQESRIPQTVDASGDVPRLEVVGQRGEEERNVFAATKPDDNDDGDVVLPKMGIRRVLGRCTSLYKEIEPQF